jgi:hypothetical protein
MKPLTEEQFNNDVELIKATLTKEEIDLINKDTPCVLIRDVTYHQWCVWAHKTFATHIWKHYHPYIGTSYEELQPKGGSSERINP